MPDIPERAVEAAMKPGRPISREASLIKLEAAAPAIRHQRDEELRERLRDMAAQKDEWAKDPEASWNAAERTVLGREAQAIRSAAASLDKEADHA